MLPLIFRDDLPMFTHFSNFEAQVVVASKTIHHSIPPRREIPLALGGSVTNNGNAERPIIVVRGAVTAFRPFSQTVQATPFTK
jgi:hypothetical protein